MTLDPDTPPQKSFTVMIERIPNHLRSAQALFEYFEKMFPGDVYTVEIALDLHELDSKTAKRKRVRGTLILFFFFIIFLFSDFILFVFTAER
jgi:hypothetical protein